MKRTTGGKPYCTKHVGLNPHAAVILRECDEADAELAKVTRVTRSRGPGRAARYVDPEGVMAQDVFAALREAPRSVAKLCMLVERLTPEIAPTYAKALWLYAHVGKQGELVLSLPGDRMGAVPFKVPVAPRALRSPVESTASGAAPLGAA